MPKLSTQERRYRKLDRWRGCLTAACILGWTLLLACLTLVHFASPEMETGLILFYDIPIRRTWLPGPLSISQGLALILCALTGAALWLSRIRSRRQGDHAYGWVILLSLCCLALSLYLLSLL